jgi:CubicO group peptidase (beta-lactamase class C family)
MKTHRIPLLILTLGLLAGLILSAAAPAQAGGELPQRLDALVQSFKQQAGIPGLALALIEDGQVTLLKGYGTDSRGQAITPHSTLYLGSLSKSVTALALMRQWDQGKLDLDAPVTAYLPDFRLADPAQSGQITVRMLLNQVSGICGQDDPDPNQTAPSLQAQVGRLRSLKLSSAPGAKYCYSNQNYMLLGAILEKISGLPFGEALRQSVFEPLEMTNSGVSQAALPHYAPPFGQFLGLAYPLEQRHFPAGEASGYTLSSIEDLTHYVRMLMDGGQYQGRTILSPRAVELLWTPASGEKGDYAMGWIVRQVNGVKLVKHDGAIESYAANIAILPERKTAVLFLANQNSLVQTFVTYPDLADQTLNLVAGRDVRTPDARERVDEIGLSETNKQTAFGVLRVLFILDLLVNGLRLAFLKKTAAWARRRPKALRFVWVALDLIFPLLGLALLAALPILLQFGIMDLLKFMTDIIVWTFLSSTLGLARGVGKLLIR